MCIFFLGEAQLFESDGKTTLLSATRNSVLNFPLVSDFAIQWLVGIDPQAVKSPEPSKEDLTRFRVAFNLVLL